MRLLQIILCVVELARADIAPFKHDRAASKKGYGQYTRQTYLSDPGVIGPVAHVTVGPHQGLSPSRYVGWAAFLAEPPTPSRPMLIDAATFSIAWAGPEIEPNVMTPTVQSCRGDNYLTWWSGDYFRTFKQGRFYVANDRYEIIYNFTTADPLTTTDPHEITITPECTALIAVHNTRSINLTTYNNISQGWEMAGQFSEYDLATGKLMFDWSASNHIPDIALETQNVKPGAWHGQNENEPVDWFHLNSVWRDETGNYLVSARHTSTIYYISGVDGAIIWRLGGNYNDFKDMSGGLATSFRLQHYARWLNRDRTLMSLYDNHAADERFDVNEARGSQGMILEIDETARKVWLKANYSSLSSVSNSKGSMQILNDSPVPGNILMGYGSEPGYTELAANGTVLLDVVFGSTAQNYRAVKANWTGRPWWGPKIAPGPGEQDYVFNETSEIFSIRLNNTDGRALPNDTVYFSWNGATEVTCWIVLTSNETTALSIKHDFLAEVSKTGFEDHLHVGADTRYVRAMAIDRQQNVLGVTPILEMSGFILHDGEPAVDLDQASREWKSRGRLRKHAKKALTAFSLFAVCTLIGFMLWPIFRRSIGTPASFLSGIGTFARSLSHRIASNTLQRRGSTTKSSTERSEDAFPLLQTTTEEGGDEDETGEGDPSPR
ncbi:hypothetical protein ANO11243_056150 [Dothideomycetidae sp. 11243]|nr:hypothetical protein ANO11243_056150 [fungal sp. No.11243]